MKRKIIITLFIIIAIILLSFLIPTTVHAATNKTVFSKNTTWDWNYFKGGDVMPYSLFTPSNIDDLECAPLIVWLHGDGEISQNAKYLHNNGLPNALERWTLEGFSSYILCPQLTGEWTGTWYDDNAVTNLKALIDKIIKEYYIDTEQIMVMGADMGGRGALYMAYHMSDYFTKCVAFSAYDPGFDLSNITIPTVCYVGTYDTQECINVAETLFKPAFGEDKVISIKANHTQVTNVALKNDDGKFNRS